ncbi:MAG: FkbM family methyltransferase [Oceanospirillaceae bacterium]
MTRINLNTQSRKFSFEGIDFNVLLETNESIISNNLEKTGGWEQNQLCLYNLLMDDDGVFVDIGANVGINAIFLQKKIPTAKVYCVEASSRNFLLLEKNMENAECDFINSNVAIADGNGFVNFSGSGTNAKIVLDDNSDNESIKSMTLDSFIKSHDITHIDLCKIDVEGFTDLVLAESALTRQICHSFIIEFSIGDVSDRFGFTETKIINHFSELLDQFDTTFSFCYISRNHGCINFKDADELYSILIIDQYVGDILVTKKDIESSSYSTFLSKIIQELQYQNHLRIEQIASLSKKNTFKDFFSFRK